MAAQLRALALTHRPEPPDKAHAVQTGDWVLDPDWHPIAFEVASSRPRVLLTIGSNALRVIAQEYQDLLVEVWDGNFIAELTDQHRLICDLQADLLHLREMRTRARSDISPTPLSRPAVSSQGTPTQTESRPISRRPLVPSRITQQLTPEGTGVASEQNRGEALGQSAHPPGVGGLFARVVVAQAQEHDVGVA